MIPPIQRLPNETLPSFLARCREVGSKRKSDDIATSLGCMPPRPNKSKKLQVLNQSLDFHEALHAIVDENTLRAQRVHYETAKLKRLLEEVKVASPTAASLCCKKNCLKSLPIEETLSLRERYENNDSEANKSTFIMKQWQANILNESIMVAGVPACNKSFTLVYGVSKNKLNRA